MQAVHWSRAQRQGNMQAVHWSRAQRQGNTQAAHWSRAQRQGNMQAAHWSREQRHKLAMHPWIHGSTGANYKNPIQYMHGKIFILVSKMIKFKSDIPTGRLADNQLLKFSISHPQIYRVILYFN